MADVAGNWPALSFWDFAGFLLVPLCFGIVVLSAAIVGACRLVCWLWGWVAEGDSTTERESS
ncbi:MAG: hypothetical protein L0Z62_36670 [Gemmataceae bacterium]|nr:hypothetical protein [Gemmataceae bacterium]